MPPNPIELRRLFAAADRAADCLSEEMNAAGVDDIAANPLLQRHEFVLDLLRTALADARRVGWQKAERAQVRRQDVDTSGKGG